MLTMSKGEKAELHIEPEWAYGRKGLPDAGYSNILYSVVLLFNDPINFKSQLSYQNLTEGVLGLA